MSKEDIKAAIQQLTKEELRQEVRGAIKELINEQYASLGKAVSIAFAVSVLGAIAYFILVSQGWRKA